MDGIRITKLERHPEHGYWTARVHNGEATLEVHCRYGSWQTNPDQNGRMRDVIPILAAELASRVRTLEARERREQEKLAETNPFVKKAAARAQATRKETAPA